ncbi:MAG: hypothetical protein ACXWKG_04820 [Limisphaerales bacterium]
MKSIAARSLFFAAIILVFPVGTALAADRPAAVPSEPRVLWSLDNDGISLHRLELDRKTDEIVGRLPYNPRYGSAERNWHAIAETDKKKLYFVRADGNSEWVCYLYSLDTEFLNPDPLQTLMVAPIRKLGIQVDPRYQHLAMTAGPDGNLYLTVYKNVIGDAHSINGLWRIGVTNNTFDFVGRFKKFAVGRADCNDSDRTPRNAFFGGISYDSTSSCFYGFGFNSQGRPRMYQLSAAWVTNAKNTKFESDRWQTNGTQGLWGIAFDNYGHPLFRVHRGNAYVSAYNEGVFRFRDVTAISDNKPFYQVGDAYMGYGIALEPYCADKPVNPANPAIQKPVERRADAIK